MNTTKTRKMLCFDMDGTIADLYNVPDWLPMLRSENVTPYVVAEPLHDMEKLRTILIALSKQGWEIRVISWLSMDSSESYKKAVRKAKIDWLCKHSFPMDRVHLIAYGSTKADSVRKATDYAVLIDDNHKVCQGWTLGHTINPTETNLIEELNKLLDTERGN